MVEWIIEKFGLVYREAWALTKASEYSKGGVGGAELDIFECFDDNCITSTIAEGSRTPYA